MSSLTAIVAERPTQEARLVELQSQLVEMQQLEEQLAEARAIVSGSGRHAASRYAGLCLLNFLFPSSPFFVVVS